MTRRLSEVIRIGDEIKVVVLGTRGTQVRIGIEAPENISVHHEEVYNRIQQERKENLKEAEG